MAVLIKVRKRGGKAWAFLSRHGTNRLRIHAVTFETREKAQALIDANAPNNPDWDWRISE